MEEGRLLPVAPSQTILSLLGQDRALRFNSFMARVLEYSGEWWVSAFILHVVVSVLNSVAAEVCPKH